MTFARMNNRYILVPRWQLFKPLTAIYVWWLFISFLPLVGYLILIIPIVIICSIALANWYDIWSRFGYKKSTYIALHVTVLLVSRIIGMTFNGSLRTLLLDWRIIYGF